MENRVETSLLMEYYGNLLTLKQQKIMHLYYDEDFSLGEIAELNQTSRQAIHDLIKRSHGLLVKYEEKLKMKETFESIEVKKQSLKKLLEEKGELDETIQQLIDGI